MNTTMSLMAFLLISGCGEDKGQRRLTTDNTIIVAPFYVDKAGNSIGSQTSDSMQIVKVAGAIDVPVLVADGHALTCGEFRAATGVAQLDCAAGGTRVH